MYEQTQPVPESNKVKGSSLLLIVEVILLVLICYGFFTSNQPKASSSINDIIDLTSLIAIIPAIILSIIGIKDGIKGVKNHLSNGVIVLIVSIILLVVTVIYGGIVLGVLNTIGLI